MQHVSKKQGHKKNKGYIFKIIIILPYLLIKF